MKKTNRVVFLIAAAMTLVAQVPPITIPGNPVTVQGKLNIVDGSAYLKIEASPNLSTMNLIGTGGTASNGTFPRMSLWDGNLSMSSNLFYKSGVGWVRDNPLTGSSRVVVGGAWIGFDIWPTNSSALKSVLVVNDQGNVGVGTSSPAAKLHLADTTADYLQAGGVFRVANNGDVYVRGSLLTSGAPGPKGDKGDQGERGLQGLPGQSGTFSCSCTAYCVNGRTQGVGKASSSTDCQSGANTFCSSLNVGLKYGSCN